MASKTIHICDRCKSYILDEKEVWRVDIIIDIPEGINKYRQEDMDIVNTVDAPHSKDIHREICPTCVQAICDQLELKEKDVAGKLFKNFQPPPSTHTHDALAKKIHDYNED